MLMDSSKRTVLVTGGNFVNKGAQSMLFCLVDHLAKRHPDCEVVLLDLFPMLDRRQKEIYRFTVLNMHIRTLLRLSLPILKLLLKKSHKSDSESDILDAISRGVVLYDIAGYGVSSHNQAAIWTFGTLLPFRLAAKYKVPVQLLSQSLGPFDYKGWKRLLVWPFVKKWMLYPERIFVREPIARQHLNKFRTEGIVDSFDLVLQAETINVENVFRVRPRDVSVSLRPESVVLIPNRQLFNLWGEEGTVSFFSEMVTSLLENGKNVVLLKHSADDKSLCENIVSRFSSQSSVGLLDGDYYPQQLDEIIVQADALISARYHGLVHGLKNNIPVFSVGWAVKYDYLMQTFGLGEFHIGHDAIDPKALVKPKLEAFLQQLPMLRLRIKEKMETITVNSIYKNYL